MALTGLVRELTRARTSVLHMHLNWPLGCRYVTTAALVARVPAVVATTHLCSRVDEVRFAGVKQRLRTAIIDRFIPVSVAMTACLRGTLGIPDAKMRVI